jgi:hypothetical protein
VVDELFDPYEDEDDDFYLDEDEDRWEDEGGPYYPEPPLEDDDNLQE